MYIGIGIIASISFLVFLKRENARRERGERDEYIDDQPETHLPENMKNGVMRLWTMQRGIRATSGVGIGIQFKREKTRRNIQSLP